MTTRPPDPAARLAAILGEKPRREWDGGFWVILSEDEWDTLIAYVRALEADRRRLALLNENAITVKVGGSYPQGPGVTALDTTWSAYVPLGQTEPEDGPLVAWIDALITSESAPSHKLSEKK